MAVALVSASLIHVVVLAPVNGFRVVLGMLTREPMYIYS